MNKEAAVAALNSTVFLHTWKASRQSGSSRGAKGKEHLIAAEVLLQKVTKQCKFLFGTELWSEELWITKRIQQFVDAPDHWYIETEEKDKLDGSFLGGQEQVYQPYRGVHEARLKKPLKLFICGLPKAHKEVHCATEYAEVVGSKPRRVMHWQWHNFSKETWGTNIYIPKYLQAFQIHLLILAPGKSGYVGSLYSSKKNPDFLVVNQWLIKNRD